MHSALPRPHRHDVLIAVAGLVSGLLLWGLGVTNKEDLRPLQADVRVLFPLFVMCALELLRRTRPQLAVVLGTVALIASEFTDGNLATVFLYTDLMYAAVVYGTPAAARRLPVTTGLVTLAITIGLLVWFRSPQALLVGALCGLVGFAPACTGALVRNHRDTAETERLRAQQTALLAEMDRVQAVTAERARMARELHDMVANHLSAIAIHSTAALSLDDPATTRKALGVIRENSVDGLAEMRRLIGILRRDDSESERAPAAAPTLGGLNALVDLARTNGLDVHLTDEHAKTKTALPAPVDLAAYRIVQESLTNALKHASAGRVTVHVLRSETTLTVEITSPYGDREGPRAPGSGAGLVGMRERVNLLDGTFDAGLRTGPDGARWRVQASLPLTPGSADRGESSNLDTARGDNAVGQQGAR